MSSINETDAFISTMDNDNSSTIQHPNDDIISLATGVDMFFQVMMSVLVLLMQAGFALLEAGSIRTKNTVNILIKNTLDCLIGGVSYYAIGWGVAYGTNGNAFIGGSQFLLYGFLYIIYQTTLLY